ncbi:MAG: hypothetical protein Q4D37_09105 [Oscillospiraceae bacterium]|nr:hypothetical protein [Oscillospiraceae bacterium]
MPQYTRRDSEAMRQDAIRRSREMYHRAVPPQASQSSDYDFLPLREESDAFKVPPQNPTSKKTQPMGLFGNWNPTELLEKLDKDQILILVLLVMLYKEGGDKKLMMALAYLLT